MILENCRSRNGKTFRRIRSSAFIWASLISLIVGVDLLYRQVVFGAFLVLTAAPFLLLYPVVRAIFGGKDSIGAAVVTAVVEETLKDQVSKHVQNKHGRR